MSDITEKVIIKLGLDLKDGNDLVFRRVNLSPHLQGNENLHRVLKLYSIQMFTGTDILPITTSGFRVCFIYVDMDGDKVMIGSSEELAHALKMHEDKGVVKILASVEEKEGEEEDSQAHPLAASRASIPTEVPSPSSYPSPPSRSFIQDPPPQIQMIVESIVGHIASLPAAVHYQVRERCAAAAAATSIAATATAPSTTPSPLPTTTTTTTTTPPSTTTTSTTPPERPFIHGRHTCDGCLTTPIVGQRFHAINLPDYDLCGPCRNNYKGTEIEFVPVELERDGAFQDRWHRRRTRWGTNHPPPHTDQHYHHHHPHHGRPVCRGLRRHYRRHGAPFGPPALHAGPSPLEVDLALKEAIRRSLADLKVQDPKENAAGAVAVAKEEATEEKEAVEADLELVESSAIATAPVAESSADEVVDDPVVDCDETKPAPTEPLISEDNKVIFKTQPACPTKMSDTSFEDEAEGNGELAKLVGSTLDKFAAAIDDFNQEFDRSMGDNVDKGEIIIACDVGNDDDNAKDDLNDADDASQGSWDVVADEQFASDEALARAAHVIGSALLQSDMIQSVQSAENVSTLSQSEQESISNESDGPSLTPSAMSVPTNPGSVTHGQMDRWAAQLHELHIMGVEDDAKIIEILERFTAANMECDCGEEVPIERILDEYYK